MFEIDINTLNVAKGLIILIISNIILGAIGSLFTQEFNWKKLYQGIIKGVIIAICFILVYYAGAINADIVAFNINGVEMNLMSAVYAILLIAYVWYGKEVLQKLSKMINAKYDIGDGM